MKPTIKKLQDALNRYNQTIAFINRNPQSTDDRRFRYMHKRNVNFGLCAAVGFPYSDWLEVAISEPYSGFLYWIEPPHGKPISLQLMLLTRRRDKLIEIIEKYDSL